MKRSPVLSLIACASLAAATASPAAAAPLLADDFTTSAKDADINFEIGVSGRQAASPGTFTYTDGQTLTSSAGSNNLGTLVENGYLRIGVSNGAGHLTVGADPAIDASGGGSSGFRVGSKPGLCPGPRPPAAPRKGL